MSYYVTELGEKTKLTQITGNGHEPTFTRYEGDLYVDNRTGELVEHPRHAVNRGDSSHSARRSVRNLCDLIYANVTDNSMTLHVVLTYRDCMSDYRRLVKDWGNFWDKLKYYFKKVGMEAPAYIEIREPQERGAWHLHVLLIFREEKPYIPKEKVSELWGHGRTSVRRLNEGEDIARYFRMQLPIDGEDGGAGRKAQVKGSRLGSYPSYAKLYTTSRDIVKPERREVSYGEAVRIRSEKKLIWRKGGEVASYDSGAIVHAVTEMYDGAVNEKNIRSA